MAFLPTLRSVSIVAIVAAAGLCIQAAELSADWPATHFQVQTREPVTLEKADIQQEIEAGTGTFDSLWESVAGPAGSEWQPLARKAEGWMNEIGDLYRKGGHEAPYIEPIVKDNGIAKYRVYIFPFTGSQSRSKLAHTGGGYQLSDCAGKAQINWVSYNADMFSPTAPLPKGNYWTFGHETFHALEYGDQLMANCFKGGMWIREGLADGASLYLINRKWPNYSGRLDGSNSATGLRHYDWPLNFSTGRRKIGDTSLEAKTSYLTSSFWRFFADNFGGIKVFPHFLDKPLAKDASNEDLLKWLDERLKTEPDIKSGLYLAYPHFVSEFASYGGSRYTSFAWRSFGKGEAARTAWLNEGFTACHQMTLTPGNSVQEITISVMKVAAICIRVKMEGFSGNVTEKIEVLADRLDHLDQLHLGWAWKIGPDGTENCYEKHKSLKSKWSPCVLKAFSQTGPSTGRYARTWPSEMIDFGESSGKSAERIYILSNVAVKPWKTSAITGYAFRVAVSDSTFNGKPAEPMEQLAVPRKNQMTPNPMMSIGKEELYGLQTSPPVPEPPIKGLGLHTYTPNRNKGVKAKAGGYGVSINQMEYGKTGPVTGLVAKDKEDPGSQHIPPSTVFCKDFGARPIGEVIQSDEDFLRISVDADLCRAPNPGSDECKNGCPVVDHLTAQVNIAFGWRQFSQTAPTDIRTPGVQLYIDTMPGSLQEALKHGANTAIPNFDSMPGTSGSGDGSDAGTGTSSSSGGTLDSCGCSCEELADFDSRAEEAKKVGDNDATMALAGQMLGCMDKYQRQYMICRMEAGEAEKQRRELLRKQEAEARQAKCDCSCEAIDDRFSRSQELEKQFAAGGSISNKVIAQLTQCATACQKEMLACAMNK